MRDVVELIEGRPSRSRPDQSARAEGVLLRHTDAAFELRRDLPGPTPVYYRVGHRRLEWGHDLDSFRNDGARPRTDHGALLALAHGIAPAPDSTPVAGVQRLTAGTTVRADADGIRVLRHRPELPLRASDLHAALTDSLTALSGNYAIGFSGGLSSVFLALSARAAGHRPPLLHADLGPGIGGFPVAGIAGLRCERVRVDASELLDHHKVIGVGDLPPIPDTEVPRLLAERLATHSGLPVAVGGVLTHLTAARLPDAATGLRDWRLLGCEPFHLSGTLDTLDGARALLAKGVVHDPGLFGQARPDESQPHAAPPPSPSGGVSLPGLTEQGAEALDAARRGALAVWRDQIEELPPVLGRAETGLAEHGAEGVLLPALDPAVLAAAGALRPSALGRIRGGRFEAQVPMRRTVTAYGVNGVRHASPRHWLRLAAAAHLHRERRKLVAELERECALADLGLLRPGPVAALLRDGRDLSAWALPVLRLLWLDRWLRG